MNSTMKHCGSRLGAVAVALGVSLLLVEPVSAQDAHGVDVEAFDQVAVTASIEEVFGGRYELGEGIAELIRERLVQMGAVSQEAANEGRIEGTIVYFGKESGRGEAAGVNVGGIRVGLGRRREVALVLLEARLIDVASGQVVTFVTGEGKSDRGGWDVAATARRGGELGSVDLSGEEFKSSAIGDATHRAVEQLTESISGAFDQLGTFAAPEPEPVDEPSEPVPAYAPAGGGVVMGAPVVGWVPYMFRGTEQFRYEVSQVEDGERRTGYYELSLQPAGENRVRMAVDGRLGEEAYASTVTTAVGAEGMQMGMNQMMALGPIGVTLLNPTSWMMLAGHELNVGDGWSYASGGESFSVRVETACSHGGQSGALVVFRENERVMMESCLAQEVPLPLRMMMDNDGSRIEMTLSSFRN